MLGTGPFAVPTFRSLYDTRHPPVALVTSRLRVHRGRPVEPVSAIRDVAAGHGTPVFDPEDVNSPDAVARLAGFGAELFVVCDYGQILAPATLAAARHGGINLHGSLLPKYRGAAPVNWALYHGEVETGVSVIHVVPKVDAGPVIAQARLTIDPDETAIELEARLADVGARLMCKTIDAIEAGRVQALPQDPTLASRAPRLKKTDGAIDWTRPAAAIKNQVRALEPWPRTYTFWHPAGGPPVRLILGPVSVVERESAAPGTVIAAHRDRLVIAAGRDAIIPATVQPAGKRPMTVAEFLRGHHVSPGDRFGQEPG